MIPKEEFKNKVMEILKENIHFAPQVDGYVVHGAIDKIWELHQLATDGGNKRTEELEAALKQIAYLKINIQEAKSIAVKSLHHE